MTLGVRLDRRLWNDPMSHEADTQYDARRGEMRRILEMRIDALPDGCRTIFVLRALEELSVEETASALEIPEATVRARYSMARGLLRESLACDIHHSLEGAFSFAGARCDRIIARVLARIKSGT